MDAYFIPKKGGDFLVKIKKRSGAMQDFDRTKLKRSMKRAGAKDEHATKVAETVGGRVREGMTTAEIKRHATTELRRMDQKTATAYETFRKPTV
jgi:transcriptional regulator NrdR family protein